MRIQNIAILVFFAVTLTLVQALQKAQAEDVFARPQVFDTPAGQSAPAPMPQYIPYGYVPNSAPPSAAPAPTAAAPAKAKVDPNMPREVFLDTGTAPSETSERKPTSSDNDEERYTPARKKKSKAKDDDEQTDDFVEVH